MERQPGKQRRKRSAPPMSGLVPAQIPTESNSWTRKDFNSIGCLESYGNAIGCALTHKHLHHIPRSSLKPISG
eukprot:scaffold403_cov113-Cylindrotheca_fusiformis.AAC.4